ncbi:MAG: hypothetical protein K2Y05_00050 [Hyphomicrobiaceae bacterium]|nr:hypothetical protein [Hyphomicrobiaceae bacterium]
MQIRSDAVHRRHVLFIPGFDPRGPSVFHGIATREAAKAQLVSGVSINVGPRKDGGNRWTMSANYDGVAVETANDVLRWDDLVRRMWLRNELALLWRALRWIELCHRRGLLAASRDPALALHRAILVPGGVGIVFLANSLIVIATMIVIGSWFGPSVGLPALSGLLLVAPLGLAARSLWRMLDQYINVCWLNRAFGYLLDHATGGLDQAAITERQQSFAQRIVDVSQSGTADEIVVIGHSIGSMHAIEAVAQALAIDPELGKRGAPIVIVTLGQCIPVPLHLSKDTRLHRALAALATQQQIRWLDVTSLSDPASSCGMDPMAKLPTSRRADFPLQQPPMFHEILSAETFRYIRRRPLDFHFQYLKASERAGGYDFFRLILGPQPVFAPKDSP